MDVSMSETFSSATRLLFSKRVIAHVACNGPGGFPHVTPVWVELDGDDILINTALGRAKTRNLAADPRVAVSLTDPDDPEINVVLHGSVVDFTSEGAIEHDDRLNRKYMGPESVKIRPDGQVRVIIRIRPSHIATQPE
jgi:PPOX class probable F420-dependent enzyme